MQEKSKLKCLSVRGKSTCKDLDLTESLEAGKGGGSSSCYLKNSAAAFRKKRKEKEKTSTRGVTKSTKIRSKVTIGKYCYAYVNTCFI